MFNIFKPTMNFKCGSIDLPLNTQTFPSFVYPQSHKHTLRLPCWRQTACLLAHELPNGWHKYPSLAEKSVSKECTMTKADSDFRWH